MDTIAISRCDRHKEAQEAVDCMHLASKTRSPGADVRRGEGEGLRQCEQKWTRGKGVNFG